MNDPDATRALARLAQRLRENPQFMAWALARYQAEQGLSNEALAEELGVPAATLVRLALCKRPHPGTPGFTAQIRQIASYTRTDPAQLAAIVQIRPAGIG